MLSYLTGFKLPLAYIFFVHPERIGTQRKWGKSSLLKYGPFPSNLRNPVGSPVECQCQKEMWKFSKAFLCCCSLFLSVRVTNDENILVLFEVRRFCCCFLNSTWRRIDYCFSRSQPPSRPLRGPETTSHPGFDLKFIYCPCVDWYIKVIPYKSEHLLSNLKNPSSSDVLIRGKKNGTG